jgi:RNA polymerase sigma-70 factor (ECF subfamily)
VSGFEFPEVLERVRAGNETAFAELWRRHQPMVLRYLTVLVGDAAEDVASETWIAVVRALDRFTGDEHNFRTWIITIARNRAMDWGRSRQRTPLVLQEQDELDLAGTPAPDPATLVVDSMAAVEAVDLIARHLPPLQAEAVILRSVLGLEVPEVAAIMKKRSGAVRVLTHRGLRHLQIVYTRREALERG